ncbi:DUF3551 domain-containing protein [Bradyrhizobium sp. U87765 SZCCT0131]|uniref:DUF3551 domain-containing protein n=1 Tax=unclassified Bradyrhizobium TaxID=2631580 RepID=UPI001BA5AA55|nr:MULTISPECIES: DUF3551 domain-containing protein [unclassified Bradyrhizobium]MBR1217927.1 DUF3551 domain-containing protein [Bradyrhizobium sp. U87765 SZCCT0131]MBR1261127.1 DUF3551 domain-containing protein [Bradyrhizobium sp. U87765 SZCCT0134]MBR1303425.1 DUF3551 domain-containing protein [Bradyrhizobium sp. U87765 SZCCT0110]MBR1319031.1 DUF3551 domain-containing protein [Bradyrhizobium sp. U87765 SZCCT0109]MBR1347356.1 DUF3551 domain-containing protein [Bradyrhizobium sp. U87765 SZCCT004
MKTALLAAAAAAVAATLASAAPARADVYYPWCRLGNHDCMYSTFQQCMAALSGTYGDCRRNVMVPPQQVYDVDAPRRHHRRHSRA